jgi:hypothetical protein
METKINFNKDILTKLGTFGTVNILFSLLGYFIYGKSLIAAVAIFTLCMLFEFVALIGFIPVAGPFMFWGIGHQTIEWFTNIAGIWQTELTEWIFRISFVISILYTVIGLVITLMTIKWLVSKFD